MLSAMFSHEPPTGVYSGMIPCANSQQTNSAVLCPARLSSTRSIRSGGNSSKSVGLMLRPSCHRSQPFLVSPGEVVGVAGGVGIAASTAANSRFSQPCSTVLGQEVTPSTRTRPSAG